jgi:aryl-alcohol dehydrogenase-like predicted oxidoreductase
MGWALMRYHLFGRSGLRVSELFLGTMTFGEQGGVGAPPEECRRIFDGYMDAGGTVVDTASNYRDGASEEILGELLVGRRDRMVVTSKYTVSRDRDDPNGGGNHRKNLRLSLECSLRRLRTDYLDVCWVHVWDRHTPVEETMRALDDEVRAGRVLYVGISDAPAWIVSRANTLAEWRGWCPFVGLQVPYSLLQRDVERDLLPMAEAYGMAVAAWGPLAGGILSGKYTRPGGPGARTRIDPTSLSDHQRSVAVEVQAVADEIGASASQVAIAWTRARSPAIHPIVGARHVDQLIDNLGAIELVLPPDMMKRLEAAAPFDLGFPTTFIREITPWVFGAADPSALTRARSEDGDGDPG